MKTCPALSADFPPRRRETLSIVITPADLCLVKGEQAVGNLTDAGMNSGSQHMKKLRPPEIKAGIWLDQEHAWIIKMTGKEEPVISKLGSGVESRVRFRGEGKVFARFGNAFISDQEKKQKRQVNQRQKYFKEIIAVIPDVDYLYLFGPGRAKEGLLNAIEKTKSLKAKLASLEAADKMTPDEAKAETVRYFNDMGFKAFKRQLQHLRKIQAVK